MVDGLRAGSFPCVAHRDRFAPDAPAVAWIPVVASEGLVIVTRDLAIRRTQAERQVWIAACAVVVMLRGKGLRAADMVTMLLGAHANGKLDNFINKRMPPMILYLHAGSRIDVDFGGERRGGVKRDE